MNFNEGKYCEILDEPKSRVSVVTLRFLVRSLTRQDDIQFFTNDEQTTAKVKKSKKFTKWTPN